MLDVIVAGAGPAGSAAALLLARAGVGVTIVERSVFPRTKPCGEYLSGATVRALCDLGLRDRLEPLAFPLDGVRVHVGGASAELPFRSPGWSIPRAHLDAQLLDAAVRAGAQVHHGRVESVAAGAHDVCVRVRDEGGELRELYPQMLIGADGAHSAVARSCGLAARAGGPVRFAIGGHYEGLHDLQRCVEMFVDGRTYFAVNPLSANSANVMLIVPESELHAHRDDVDFYVRVRGAELSRGRLSFDGASLQGKRVAVGPLAYRARAFSAPRVLLAGDAAQFVDPFAGQGVYLALFGGSLAARTVIAVLRGGVPFAAASRAYCRRLAHELRRRKRLSALVSLAVRMPFMAPHARFFAPLLDAVSA